MSTTAAIGVISAVAFLGNILVIYVLLARRKSFLKKSYNVFILNLAVVDCITAILLPFSRFLYLPPIPSNEFAANVYCYTIWGPWIVFTLGYISIYTCVMLTIERWFAVVKPQTYRFFKLRHAILAVVFVWFWGTAVNTSVFFRIKYEDEKKRCQWTPLPVANEQFPWVDFFLQTLFPMSTMVVLYVHIYHTLKKLPNLTSDRKSQLKRVTLVAVAACFAIIVGWVPGRITFMLSKYGILEVSGAVHMTSVTITFLNSCVNPIIYGICSSRFRQEYKMVFRKLLVYCKAKDQARLSPANESDLCT